MSSTPSLSSYKILLVILWSILVLASTELQPDIVAPLTTVPTIVNTIPPEPSVQSLQPVQAATTSTEPPPILNPEDLKLEFTDNCFYTEPELCLSTIDTDEVRNCDCQLHPTYKKALYCCNVTDIDKAVNCAASNLTNLEFIHIRNATLEDLDFSDAKWKFFKSIAITDGNITKISNHFYKFAVTKCLNVSNNSLMEMNTRILTYLQHVDILDMSYNNLSAIPNISLTNRNLTLDFRGNNQIPCKSVLESMSRTGIQYIEPENTFCLVNQTFSWFNSSNYVPLTSLMRMKQLQDECPTFEGNKSCSCKGDRLNYENLKDKQVIFTARVDCSGLGLTKLPDTLPMDTVHLNVSYNKISNLTALNHKSYQSVVKFYADHNLITTILDLEGSHLIQNFDELSLRYNKLKNIPIYLFSNTLDRNPRKATISLDGNPFFCDCNTAKHLKIWLLARQVNIKEYQSIRCETGERVVELQESKICHSPHVWTDYIYWIIAAEIFLLVALICKVSYDYFVFKTSGYLPWPASQIPKIPFCDWLCET